MSTRGLWGIRGITGREDGKTEIGVVCYSDAFPSRLGADIMFSLKNNCIDDYIINVNMSQNGIDFIYDSLWCEWAYMINLETQCLEIYRGFNTDPQEAGPYASKKSEDSSDILSRINS